MGCAAAYDGARRNRRRTAARIVRQDDRRQEFPVRHADAAAGRDVAVRHAPARQVRRPRQQHRRRRLCAASAGSGARRILGDASAAVQSLPAMPSATFLPAVTRPAITATNGPKSGRPMPTARSKKPAPCRKMRATWCRSPPAANTATPFWAVGGRTGAGVVQGLPRPRTSTRCAVATPGDGRGPGRLRNDGVAGRPEILRYIRFRE